MLRQLREVWDYRQMLFSMVRKDLRSRYRGSVLGFLWTFINPLMQLLIYSLVFPFLLRMQEENYSMFVFTGLLPWIFFTSSLQGGTNCVVGNGNLVKKIYFPRLVLPLSVVTTNAVNYLLALVIVFAAILIVGIPLSPFMLLLPVVFLVQYLFTAGLTMALSAMYVYFRDLEHIVGIVTMAWLYVTPVIFSFAAFPEWLRRLLQLNPMTQIIDGYRAVLLYAKLPDTLGFLGVTVLSLLVFFIGTRIFAKLERNFAEEI